jgi:hypothetical protein
LFAAEYPLARYVLFLETLQATGYDNDVVVAISKHDYGGQQICQRLQDNPHVIANVIEYTCWNAEKETVDTSSLASSLHLEIASTVPTEDYLHMCAVLVGCKKIEQV